jgi:hypothetical protein
MDSRGCVGAIFWISGMQKTAIVAVFHALSCWRIVRIVYTFPEFRVGLVVYFLDFDDYFGRWAATLILVVDHFATTRSIFDV